MEPAAVLRTDVKCIVHDSEIEFWDLRRHNSLICAKITVLCAQSFVSGQQSCHYSILESQHLLPERRAFESPRAVSSTECAECTKSSVQDFHSEA